jgi:N-methylhydantoinase B/oxoprolinase/acetone carboxylase alpha subunit
VELEAGDVVELRLAGGGGWGDPARRGRDALARDLADGIVTAAAAPLYDRGDAP